jgi:hypothetical protein
LAERLWQEAGLIGQEPAHDAAYFEGLPDVLDGALKVLPEHRYDAIVVDEGQDLDSVWWLPLLDLLRDPAQGIVYVFGDANQDLYHSSEPAELGVVMPESPPIYHLAEDRRCTQTIHAFASRWAAPATDARPALAVGPEGRPVEIFIYPEGSPDACRRVLGTALRRIIEAGRVAASDVVVLTPRPNRSSWLMAHRRRTGRGVAVSAHAGIRAGGERPAAADEGQRGARGDDPSVQGPGVTGRGAGRDRRSDRRGRAGVSALRGFYPRALAPCGDRLR